MKMEVVWVQSGNLARAQVGDYALFAGWGSVRGSRYIFDVRAGREVIHSGSGEDSLEDAMDAAADFLEKRLVELYGGILDWGQAS